MSKTYRELAPEVHKDSGVIFLFSHSQHCFCLYVVARWPPQLQIIYSHTTASKHRKAVFSLCISWCSREVSFCQKVSQKNSCQVPVLKTESYIHAPAARVARKPICGHFHPPQWQIARPAVEKAQRTRVAEITKNTAMSPFHVSTLSCHS